jgi:hypothetical protein
MARELSTAELTTGERRALGREPLEGRAAVHGADRATSPASTIDLGEGGLSLLCGSAPELGAMLHVDLDGLVVEGRVKHVAPEGVLYRVGIETA